MNPGIVEPISPGSPEASLGTQPSRRASSGPRRLRPVAPTQATSASQVRSAVAATSTKCSST